MGELRANDEDVRFDFAAATYLASRFRATAQQLEDQIGRRGSLAELAAREWRGLYARKFDTRTGQGRDGARMLAHSMRDTAAVLDQQADDARAEQQRREYARAWFEAQKSANPLTWLWDRFEDWWSGPDVPPSLRPTNPPPRPVSTPGYIPASRE